MSEQMPESGKPEFKKTESKESSGMKMPKFDKDLQNKLLRGVYIIIFLILGYIAAILIALIAIFQFIYTVIVKAPQPMVLQHSRSLTTFFYSLILFLTYQSEIKPFPFSPWPKG